MTRTVLRNSLFGFTSKFKQHVSGTVIGARFKPPYVNLFMDRFEASFLETQLKRSNWSPCYGSDTSMTFSLYGCMVKKNVTFFWKFDPCIIYTYESDTEINMFFYIKVSLRNSKVFTDVYVKPTDHYQYLHYLSAYLCHTKKLPFTRLCPLAGHVVPRRIWKFIKRRSKYGFGKGSTQRIWSVLKWEKLSFPTYSL